MSSNCCCQDHSKTFEGLSPIYKRILVVVIILNFVMFCVEMFSGFKANSQSLKADSLDFIGDSITYALSLIVIGMPQIIRSRTALFKAMSLFFIATIVFITTFMKFWSNTIPQANTITIIGTAAMFTNILCVLLLVKWKDGDANVRSVWLCSRNDAISNIGIILTGVVTFYAQSRWPDLIMAAIIALIFLRSSYSIIQQAREEIRLVKLNPAYEVNNHRK